jgi:hypothetical protein
MPHVEVNLTFDILGVKLGLIDPEKSGQIPL